MYLAHNTDNRKGIKLFMYHLWNEKVLIKRKRLEMGEAERRGLQEVGLLWDDAVQATLLSLTRPVGPHQRLPGLEGEGLALSKLH